MSNQICLKWNSFLNNIATSFESLWEEKGLVDVTLSSNGRCLKAHKVILSASSPFFKKVFQTNPCHHLVILFKGVHFSELQALLIFIYKGEVNIEQKNLPALLEAAEALQIRGLSGGDIFAKESYKKLAELEQAVEESVVTAKEETSRKKQKLNKHQNSILESALTPRISQLEGTDESTTSDQGKKEGDYPLPKNMLQNPIYQRLEMKIEPIETAVDNAQKQPATDKDPAERLDTGQSDGNQEMADIKPDHKVEDTDNYGMGNNAEPKNMQELTEYVQTLLQNMQGKFQTMLDQILGKIDEMGNRIDDLEKNITDLMTQAGVEGGEK
nr:protein bric-a-brac 2-like isoform X2 [Osmia lignaria]